MTLVHHEEDANLRHLAQRRVALIGYGRMGRALALNLRDSGLKLLIGNQDDRYASRARIDGFEVLSISESAQQSDMLFLTLPDEVMSQIYLQMIAPHLRTGDMLVFASGYSVAFGFIEPPAYVDAGLIAPRTLAAGVRDGYVTGLGFPCFVSIAQDGSGRAWNYLLALALAAGALKQGAIEVSFNQEVELDLFWQQAILPALHSLLLTAAQVLIREGYPPELALTELYLSGELGSFFARAAVTGLSNTIKSLSLTGQYGMLARIEQFQETKIQRQMESILNHIRQGNFAQEWAAEFADGYPRLETLRRRFENTALWRHEELSLEILRGLLPRDDEFSEG